MFLKSLLHDFCKNLLNRNSKVAVYLAMLYSKIFAGKMAIIILPLLYLLHPYMFCVKFMDQYYISSKQAKYRGKPIGQLEN